MVYVIKKAAPPPAITSAAADREGSLLVLAELPNEARTRALTWIGFVRLLDGAVGQRCGGTRGWGGGSFR
jgi:hypothetical protein